MPQFWQGQHKPGHGFGVIYLSAGDHAHQPVQRQTFNLDDFIRVQVLSGFLQVARQVDMDLLVRVAGHWNNHESA